MTRRFRRPSRLHRLTPGTWPSLLTVDGYEMPFSLPDRDLTKVTIRHGSGDRGGGFSASVCEFTTTDPGMRRAVGGYRCDVNLTTAAAAAIGTLTGTSSSKVTDRWAGRLAVNEVDDRGDTSAHTTATIRGTSWLTQMVDSLNATSPTKGRRIDGTLQDALGITTGTTPRGIVLNAVRGTPDRVAVGETENLFWTQYLGKYITEPGYIIRQRRDGAVDLLTLPWLVAQAASTPTLPLVRSRAIRPARWAMHNERPPRDHHYTYTQPNDTVRTDVVSLPNNVGEINGQTHIDYTHVYDDTDQLHLEVLGRAHSESVSDFRIPTVTVDLLTLFSSPHSYHHELAGHLLALEVYDPVPLSGDWPWQTRGVHFAAGITETITPRAWTLELTLVPHQHMTGQPSPAVRQIIWDQMIDPWEQTTDPWDTHTT